MISITFNFSNLNCFELQTSSDIVIVGGGLGGLLCGALLAKEGKKVVVLEKNKQLGGSLQSFGVDGKLFESAVHYIGSLQKGQTLFKLFNYLDIIDSISLKRLDLDCFDQIIFGNKSYALAQGYENFIETLSVDFPHQRENLVNYIREIKTVCSHFPLYNMRMGSLSEKLKVTHFSLKEKMEALISDNDLRQILVGNHLLYAGNYESTPFYIHALIENSYIESSWKCQMGSIQIAKCLQEIIHQNGGQVLRNKQVTNMVEQNGKLDHVETSDNETYFAKQFISNVHPAYTYAMLDSKMVKPITKKRIQAIPNTPAALMINISLHPESILYRNHNIYLHKQTNVWLDFQQPNDENPNSFGIFFYQDAQHPKYARGLSILTYMAGETFREWEHTFHTTTSGQKRDMAYEKKKEALASRFINEVSSILPGLPKAVKKIDVCSPLTYRDYLNIPNGSMYGLKKDVTDLANTTFATHTKIPNLFLTGQNINMHGILGVSITAILTCGELLGLEYLVEKINRHHSQ
nr:NAD(P)/FAD-dependent oxidoreductase [Chitinophagaceae bacterium]